MRRKRRYFTILVIPHTEENTFSFRLPLFVVQALVALSVVGMICFLALISQYRSVLNEAAEARALREANRMQQQILENFAEETENLLAQMSQVDELAQLVATKLGISLDEDGEDAKEEEAGKSS